MNKHIYTGLLVVCLPFFCLAQLPINCNGNAPRIALAGDSWAQYMADDGTHNRVFNMYGHGDKYAISETYEVGILCGSSPGANDYTVSGSEARQWSDEANYNYLQNLINALNANPQIDFVMLSIGGNDILAGRSEGGWYKDMDSDVGGSEQALFDQIVADTEYIINEVWSRARPNIKFVLSGYDFPNFNVTGSFVGQDYCSFYACPKREDLSRDANNDGAIDATELMNDVELNAMMNSVEQLRRDMANTNPLIYYDNGQGLMHYYYGFDDPGYPAFSQGTTSKPLGVSPFTPGGNVNVPTDRDNFRTVAVCGLGAFPADPIHLDADGYEYKIKNQFDNIFFQEFRGTPDVTFFSDGATDGYVDTDDQTVSSNGIRVGDDGWEIPFTSATNIYKGILSFNTASLPDNANVTSASLYMIRSGAADNPFEKGDRSAILDIKKGAFNDDLNLTWTDGDAPADAADIACFNGLAGEDGFAIRADLNSGLDQINNTGFTQLRMSFDVADWSTEYINFYDGGGTPALLPPPLVELQNPPAFEYRVTQRVEEADGTVNEIELERGPEMEQREGYVYQEKLKKIEQNEAGEEIVYYATVIALEHKGLAEYMINNHAAPGNGYAPFLDITYELVLPVDLLNFNARAEGHKVLLTWQTEAEQNSDYFIIEHSTDSQNWAQVAKVAAAGTSTELLDYEQIHNEPIKGKNYYRLRSTDRDGSISFSEIRNVYFQQGTNELEIYPNPFTDAIRLEGNFLTNSNTKVEISDILGKVVYSEMLSTIPGNQEIYLNNLSDLSRGTYLLRLFVEGDVYSGKIIKN